MQARSWGAHQRLYIADAIENYIVHAYDDNHVKPSDTEHHTQGLRKESVFSRSQVSAPRFAI